MLWQTQLFIVCLILVPRGFHWDPGPSAGRSTVMKNLLSAQQRGLAVAEDAVGELRPGAAQLSPAASEAASHKGGLSCPQPGTWSLSTALGQGCCLGRTSGTWCFNRDAVGVCEGRQSTLHPGLQLSSRYARRGNSEAAIATIMVSDGDGGDVY